jgi:teichuronic acid biosynthesis glycosyltransferase TuaG
MDAGREARGQVVSDRQLDRQLVTIITPVFNAERFIEETIRSALAQTYVFWEMLVLIDKGTNDRTAEIVKKFAHEDSRIRLIDVPNGRSVQDARNYGFTIARGKYVAFLDADDLWMPTKLEKQIALLKSSGAAVCYTHFRRMSVDGTRIGQLFQPPLRMTYSSLLKNNSIGSPTPMVDQEKTGPLLMETNRHEDYALWLKLVRQGFVAVGINEDLARYRIVPTGRAARKDVNLVRRWHVYRDLEQLSVVKSAYYWVCYLFIAVSKYFRF